LEVTLNYGKETKKGHMIAALFYQNVPNAIDDIQGDDNNGLRIRRNIFSAFQEIDIMGRLHTYIFAQTVTY
jgi:hypothetical protein